jgi:hypothetical protein
MAARPTINIDELDAEKRQLTSFLDMAKVRVKMAAPPAKKSRKK